ncbi:unnamed protein product [Toxocara canis]|uniref:G protein-coupled receptor n=1 Tax=Toxocara canis TaxID=6265 RepID=A0A183UFJ5_TOXCA|nr:unnamed protein product [Toxocara canis]
MRQRPTTSSRRTARRCDGIGAQFHSAQTSREVLKGEHKGSRKHRPALTMDHGGIDHCDDTNLLRCHSDRYDIFLPTEYPVFIVICAKNPRINNKKTTACLAFIPWMVGATLSAIADSLPCCGFKLQYEVFSIVPLIPPNMNTTTNYADIFVRLPTNITSTIVIVFCYTSIVFRIERFRKNGSTAISDAHQTIEADYKYAMQFFAIAVTYSFTWISLRQHGGQSIFRCCLATALRVLTNLCDCTCELTNLCDCACELTNLCDCTCELTNLCDCTCDCTLQN